MARYTVTRRNESSSYIDPVSMTISLTNEELQTFTDALQPTGYSECIIQQLLDLINPPIASEKTEQERKWKAIGDEANTEQERKWKAIGDEANKVLADSAKRLGKAIDYSLLTEPERRSLETAEIQSAE